MSQISVLGTGNMGAALIRALVKGGTSVTIWNRTRAKAEALARPGVTVANASGEALAASPCSILCLSRYPDSQQLLEAASPQLAGKSLIQLTTGKPAEARGLARFVQEQEGHYVDGAIMGVPSHVGTPQNIILYSGNKAVFEVQRPLLEHLGGLRYLGEDPGAASAFDLSVLMPTFTMAVGVLQGRKACNVAGIPAEQYDAFIREWLPLLLEDTLGKARRDGFATDPTQAEVSVGQAAPTARLLAEYCLDVNIDPSLFEALTRLFQGGVDSGYQDYDWVYAAELRADNSNR